MCGIGGAKRNVGKKIRNDTKKDGTREQSKRVMN